MLSRIVECIDNLNINWITDNSVIQTINSLSEEIIYNNSNGILNRELYKALNDILYITNSIYESFGENIIDDGIYDLLQQIYVNYNNTQHKMCKNLMNEFNKNYISSIEIRDEYSKKEYSFSSTEYFNDYNPNDYIREKSLLFRFEDENLNFKDKEINHSDNTLVGTLDKCKFILMSDVDESLINDSNITILERDFFGKHIRDGILDPNREFTVTCELKYDGVSIECLIKDGKVFNAVTRGDLYNGVGVNRLPILASKTFPSYNINDVKEDNVKFEAIITYPNMYKFNTLTGSSYKNPRTCISGLTNRLDGNLYSEFITLVPLKSSNFSDYNTNMTRSEEIEIINKLYSSSIDISKLYCKFTGNYISILYQIKKFMMEADTLRDHMPFMYDGIVISYEDKDIVNKLGRVNHIDKYSIALKFPSISKLTKFREYFFTVGKDGRITPMAKYDVVEFIGTIHTISTLHSYRRYKDLGLIQGETIKIDYVNDCMPYISKYENIHNDVPEIVCPSCGSQAIVESDSAYCPNMLCEGRNIARVSDMISKLGFDGMSEAFVVNAGVNNLYSILNLDYNYLSNKGFGDVQIQNIFNEINKIKSKPILDYDYIGSFGFTGVSSERFKTILSIYSLDELMEICDNKDINKLTSIKGIGVKIADVIIIEMDLYKDDIMKCINVMNVIPSGSNSNVNKKVIRFSGIRDDNILNELKFLGHDISYGSIVKNTDYLIIPNNDYNSNKISKAKSLGVNIVTYDEFINNILGEINK